MTKVVEAVKIRSRVGNIVRVGLTICVLGTAALLLVLLSRETGATPNAFSLPLTLDRLGTGIEKGTDGTFYARFTFPSNMPRTREAGKPEMPLHYEQVALPCNASDVTVAAAGLDEHTTTALLLHPVPQQTPREGKDGVIFAETTFTKDAAFYASDEWFPMERAAVDSVNTLRGSVCYASIVIAPYQYNPARSILLFAPRLSVTVRWKNPPTIQSAPASIGKRFDTVVQQMGLRNAQNSGAKNIEVPTNARVVNGTATALSDGTVSRPTNLLMDQNPTPPHTGYIMIANNDLVDGNSVALDQLATFRSQAANGGYDVSIVKVSDVVTTQFPDIVAHPEHTFTDAERVKVFLKYAYENWNDADPAPEFVLLAGDGDGTANQNVPVFLSNMAEASNTPADFWYVANLDSVYPHYLTDSGNPIGDMFIGRMPVKTDTELGFAVAKTIQLESTASTIPGAWRSQAGLWQGFQPDQYAYVPTSNSFLSSVDTASLTPHSVQSFTQHRESLGNDGTSRTTYHDATIADMQQGHLLFVESSHGSINTWNDGGGTTFALGDIASLNNSEKPPFILSLACSTGAFNTTYTDSLAEALLKNNANGAAAYVGATGIAYLSDYYVLEDIASAVMNQHITTLGAAVTSVKNDVSVYGDTRLTFEYFGDPALDIGKTLQASTGLPDLSASASGYTITNQQVTVYTTMQNTGFSNAANVALDLYENGTTKIAGAETIIPQILAGESITTTIIFPLPTQWTAGFATDLTVTVDDGNQIQELSESNNNSALLHTVVYDKQEQMLANGAAPSQNGTVVVYGEMRNGNEDIFLYDRSTKTERRISSDPSVQRNPATDGRTIVYQDYRSAYLPALYAYDIASGQEKRLTSASADTQIAVVDGNNTVWEDWRNNTADIYRYNKSTGQETRLTTNTKDQMAPSISGDTVAWLDNRDGHTEIYSYNLTTAEERRITSVNSDKEAPVIHGSVITWTDNRNGTYDVYTYDLSNGSEHRITNGAGDTSNAVFDGKILAWIDLRNSSRDVYALNVGADGAPGTTDDGSEMRLTDNPSVQFRSHLSASNGLIVYQGRLGTTMIFQVDALQAFTPTATNRDGVLVGNNNPWTDYTGALRAQWVRVNHNLDGSPSPDLSTAKAYLDAGINVVLTISNRDANNIDDPKGEFSTYTSAGFPFPNTPAGLQKYQDDVGAVLVQLVPYLGAGRTIYVQAENEVIDASYLPDTKYWRGTTQQYLALLDALAEKVHTLHPSFKVVLSSFTNSSLEIVTGPTGDSAYQPTYDFLTELLNDSASYDVADLHFYGCPTSIAAKVDWLRSHMPAEKIWISTENSGPMPNFCDYIDWHTDLAGFEQVEANQVTSRMTACAQNGGSICLWFSLFDLASSGDEFSHLGLLTQESTPREKLAYTAFQNYTALNTNAAPVLTPIGNQSVLAGTTLTFDVSGSDPDNNPLAYSASNLPAGATFLNQTFTWTPTTQQAGTFPNIHFSITDGALTDTEDITITVTVNQPPVLAVISNQSVAERATVSFTASASDPENDALLYNATNLPSGALFSGRSFRWTTGGQSAGTYIVHVTVTDGQYTDAQDVTIAVTDVTMPTIAALDQRSVTAGDSLGFSVTATDADNDPLTITADGLPNGSTFVGQQFSWTPTSDQVGNYSVDFTVSDAWSATTRSVSIAVLAAPSDTNTNSNVAPPANSNTNMPSNTNVAPPSNTNAAPTPQSSPLLNPITAQTIILGTTLTLPIGIIKQDNAPVSLSVSNLPTGAQFVDNGDGTGSISWTPSASQIGMYIITIVASNALGTSTQDVIFQVQTSASGGSYPFSKNFTAFPASFKTGFTVASGNVWGDVRDEIVVGTGPKTVNMVRVYSNDGTLLSSFSPYPKSFTGGVRVAACDLNGDGVDEVLAAPGSGYKPYIRIFNVQGKQVLKKQMWALDGKTTVGLQIACADLNGDGNAEIVAASDIGAGQITVHRPNGTRISNFLPFGKSYRRGMTVAALSTTSGMRILAAKAQGGEYRTFTPQGKRSGPGYAPFGLNFTGGLALAAGDVNSDGKDEIIVTPLSGTKPRVKIYASDFRTLIKQFYAYPTTFTGGLRGAIGDTDGDGTQDIITVPASKRKSDVLQFDWQGKSISS